ncbi:MAG TPA: hypothetical protein VIJ15_00315 [Dermatophilaceae bacterium]
MTSVPGYTYGEPPATLKQSSEAMDASGMFTSTVVRGVKDGSGTEVAAIILMQYNPKMTVLLDKKSPSKILDGGVMGLKASIPGKMTVTSQVLSGTPVRLVKGADVSFAIVYKHGGELIQVAGPKAAPVLKFTGAYLAANR